MPPRKLAIFGLAAAVLNCCGLAQSEATSASGIEGVILISPTPPRMTREAVTERPTPLANASFAVVKETGEAIGNFTTDGQGRFRIATPPGHYRVSQPDNTTRVRRCGPWDVDVAEGQMTKVEWYCEVGGAPLQRANGRVRQSASAR